MSAIIIIYILVSLALIYWVFSDMASNQNIRHRKLWWLLLATLPIIGTILYFQTKKRREFKPVFKEQRFS